MADTALALVHDVPSENRRAMLGSLSPALERRGFTVDIRDACEMDTIDLAGVDVLCVMGSAASVDDAARDWIAAEMRLLQAADAADTPIFGICFGGQILARALGGSVGPSAEPEHGFTRIRSTRPELVPAGPWMQFHHDTIGVPARAEVIARTDHNVQAYALGRHLGVQFHPEITPECFALWCRRMPATDPAATGIDLVAIAAEVERRSRSAATACDELLGRFLDLVDGGGT
ncbi:type 1 glutamine amidotransferase [Gordonia sp. CPCC 205515]|uniref:type 1 glutamine amidotransferase n=1 Tax=Gordonia sp. CPCC 205515 TaxID=3140791 RepID=UPI003AF3DEB3